MKGHLSQRQDWKFAMNAFGPFQKQKPKRKTWIPAALWSKGTGILTSLSLLFLLTASKCDNETRFIGAKQEICGDGIDNDDNGKADCADSYCQSSCVLELSVNPTFQTSADSQMISGRHNHASKIVVELLPNYETNGFATITGLEWSFMARKLANGTNNVTITASDSAGNKKTETTTIKVQTSI